MKNIFRYYPYVFKLYQDTNKKQTGSTIKYYNFWPKKDSANYWFTDFINYHKLNPKNRNLTFLSVFGYKEIAYFTNKPRIFFTGENLMYGNNPFEDHYKNNVALAMGYKESDARNYLRFPLWILSFVGAETEFEAFKQKIARINSPNHRQNTGRTKFACHISRHDNNGLRGRMLQDISKIAHVDSAGKFQNNTKDLSEKYGENKIEFMRQYRFNICPENTDTPLYVTEKVFDAIEAGCIPIYWGSSNNPEPEILNHDALLFYNDNGSNHELLEKIKLLQNDHQAYLKFCETPPFLPDAAENIWRMIEDLKSRLTEILK